MLDDVACFVLEGQADPTFFDRKNVYMSELRRNGSALDISIMVDNHDWIEAQFSPDDFKKYEAWKDR